MIVRSATKDDAESIARVHVSSWQHAYRGIVPDSVLDRLSVEARCQNWVEAIANGEPDVFVAEDFGRIVGFCSFGKSRDSDLRPGDFEIWSIYLESAHWSKGIGTALWHAARDELITLGAQVIRVWVLRDNHRAIRFYLASGFHPEPDWTNVLNFDGVDVVEARYCLTVRD